MIKFINGKNHVLVSHYAGTPYISPGAQSAGMLRWNSSSNTIEVYDGVGWQPFNTGADISLTGDAEMAIEWAQKKMLEEAKIDELCQKYPGLAKARSNYETFLRLVESQESVSNS